MSAPVWADGLLRLAMRAHPREFRERYEREMRAYFADAWRDADGWFARLGLLARGTVGAVSAGLRQRWRGTGTAGGGTGRLDLRHAVRSLVRRPGLAAVIVGTLAIGAGANAAVFGTLYSVVLAPLPYETPDRLVRIYQHNREEPGQLQGYLTLPAATHFRDNSRTLSALAPVYTYNAEGADLTGVGRPERLRVLRVGADYFEVLARPATGRSFRRDEETGEARVAIVSAALADRLGPTAELDGRTFDIVGSMPPGFQDPLMGGIDVWLPMSLPTGGYESWEWDNHYLSAIGRLAPGATLEGARAEIEQLSRVQGEIEPTGAYLVGSVVPLQEDVVGASDTLLGILMSAAGLLLLLTLVNVAVLLVARSLDRVHEVAVRTALGSPRWRLARQYLFEGALLAAGGGLAGILLALPVQRVLAAMAPEGALNRAAEPSLWPIVAFGVGIVLVAGAVFGIAPAFALRGVDPDGVLRQAGRGSERRGAARVRRTLVVVQVAMALVLLIGAGVLVKSLARLRGIDLNLRTETVVTFEANLPAVRYSEPADQLRFRTDLASRLEDLPGVRAAGAISHLPVTGRYLTWGVMRAVGESEFEGDWVGTDQRVVSGRAFEVLGIPLVAGRLFDAGDDRNAAPRVVINEALADALFGSAREAVGRGVGISNVRREVIGVVANVPVGARGEVAPMAYHSDRQFSAFWSRNLVQVLDTEPGRAPSLTRIAAVVREIDPDLVVYRPARLADVVGAGRAPERFAARLLATFAGLAVILSALGLYGILAHAVRRRRREIGIRLALGAAERSVLALMVREGLTTALLGTALGLPAAWIATRGLEALVYGVGVRDPWVFGSAAAAMASVALVASFLPALRATRVSPSETFRAD